MISSKLALITAWLGVALAVTFATREVSTGVHLTLVPLYTLFLFVSVANLTNGVRSLLRLVMIPILVGMMGDALGTTTASAASWMETFGFSIGALALAAACYISPKRRWNVILSGIAPLPLAVGWAFRPELFAAALKGSLGGFWLTLVIVSVQHARSTAKANHVARKAVSTAVVVLACTIASEAQELEPRAYGIAPVGTTIGLIQVGGSKGGILFDSTVGVTDVQADLTIATTGFGYTFDLAGRQARVLAVLPTAFGNITGEVGGQSQRQDLSGLADPRIRFSIGLKGAPARSVAEITELARIPKRSAMGVAVTCMPPLGQYSGEQIANIGYNRWAFKPEFGITQTFNRWTIDGAAGVWLFTENDHYYPSYRHKTQSPLISLQGHVSYALPHRMWIALDGTFFIGGETRVDGSPNPDRQENARMGTTLSVPMGSVQTLKFAYSTGLRTLRGTDFDNFSVTWQVVRF